MARRCVNGKSCHLSGQKGHHPSLCESLAISNLSIQQWKTSGEESRETPNLPAHTPTTNMFIGAKNSVFLQTARANIYKPDDNDALVKVRLIFDSSSQRSYVTESLQKFSICQYTMTVRHTRDKRRNEDLRFRVCSTPVSNQMVEFTQTHYQHLQSLELADSTQGTDELSIDLLIGADFYWQFVTEITVRGVIYQTRLCIIWSSWNFAFES